MPEPIDILNAAFRQANANLHSSLIDDINIRQAANYIGILLMGSEAGKMLAFLLQCGRVLLPNSLN
jgi:hypothetical protein